MGAILKSLPFEYLNSIGDIYKRFTDPWPRLGYGTFMRGFTWRRWNRSLRSPAADALRYGRRDHQRRGPYVLVGVGAWSAPLRANTLDVGLARISPTIDT